MKSLLEQLPSIVAEGKREAEQVMERAESNYRLGLQTRELVIPSRDSNWQNLWLQAKSMLTHRATVVEQRSIEPKAVSILARPDGRALQYNYNIIIHQKKLV